jgi:hypothetical protein
MKRSLLVAAAMLAATPALAESSGGDATAGFVILAALLFFYLLPTFVAWRRGHHQAPAIFVLNLAFGWTVIGWIGAMIWANTAVVRRNADGTVG